MKTASTPTVRLENGAVSMGREFCPAATGISLVLPACRFLLPLLVSRGVLVTMTIDLFRKVVVGGSSQVMVD
jgi:hypothetical protein